MLGVAPSQDSSDHQTTIPYGWIMVSYKPSFVTVTGEGATPKEYVWKDFEKEMKW